MKRTLSFILVLMIIAGGLAVYRANAAEKTVTIDGVVYSADRSELISYPNDKIDAEFSLPESVTEIKKEAFAYNRFLKKVNLDSKLRTIGSRAFLCCGNLREVMIPDSVTKIGSQAFFECVKVKTIKIGDGLKNLKNDVFNMCIMVRNVHLGKGLEKLSRLNGILESENLVEFTVSKNNRDFSVKDGVLYSKDKTKIIRYPAAKSGKSFLISAKVNTIGADAFAFNKKIKKLVFGANVKTVKQFSFFAMGSLNKVVFPKNCKLRNIGMCCFGSCNGINKISIPESVRTINEGAFSDCKILKKVSLCEGLKTIGNDVFSDCKKLKSIEIPRSVKSIGNYALGYYGYNEESSEYKTVKGFTVKGFRDSAAHQYAKQNGFKFIKL